MGWAFLFLGLLFAPIVWGLTKGRGVREVTEDHSGATGYGDLINKQEWPGGSAGGGGGSGGTNG